MPIRAGFVEILDSLQTNQRVFSMSAYDAICLLLTYDYRIPLQHGFDALSDIEQEICRLIATQTDQKLTTSPQRYYDDVSYCIFYNRFGRMCLRSETDLSWQHEEQFYPVGYLSIPKALVDLAEAAVLPRLEEELSLRTQIIEELTNIEKTGQLDALLTLVEDSVRHVEAVYIYVDDELWSVMERSTTLIDRHGDVGILSKLRDTPLAEWDSTEYLGVAALRALFLSGGSIRFEEFNGKLITAKRLFSKLQELLREYSICSGTSSFSAELGLFKLAEAVKEAAMTLVRYKCLRYRRVYGLTFLKTEHMLHSDQLSEGNYPIPQTIIDLYEKWRGKGFEYADDNQIFAELTDIAIAKDKEQGVMPEPYGPATTLLEILIQEIVASAVLATNADYGMSSALRDLRFLNAPEYSSLLRSVLILKPHDFYCCIVSRSGLREELGDRIWQDVYKAVQARMQYNRWHFIIGNFPEVDIPHNRHYYYPPVMPDLTEWSDQHHAGHIKAGVKYSIRSPGPDVAQPPLLVFRRPYRGFYDVRVVRMLGSPFTIFEMLVARQHSLWMGVVWNRIVSHFENDPGSVSILGFATGNGYEMVDG